MDGPQPKDDLLWGFIARAFYLGAITVAALIVIALLCDLIKILLWRYSNHHTRGGDRWQRFYSYFVTKLHQTHLFYYLDLTRLAITIAICALYVYCTYQQNVPIGVTITYRITALFFVINTVIRLFVSESAISAAFTLQNILLAFSFPSLYIAQGSNAYLNFAFLLAVPAYTSYIQLERRLLIHIFDTKRFLLRLAVQCFTLFFTLAAAIQLLEIPGDLLTVAFREKWIEFGKWNFLNAAYFIIVTLSTVGYGDFSPATVQGRIFTLIIIIVGIVTFGNIISDIVSHATKGRGSGSFSKTPNSRHIIVTGTPTLTDLTHFVSEFYSDSRQSNVKAKIAVLIENPKWSDTEWFQHIARNQFLQLRLTFMIGSVRNSADLARARIHSADAVFILTSPSTGEDPSEQDTRTVMNILAIRNARTDIPIYAQTLLEDSSLQSKLALKTASAGSREDTHFRHLMDKNATYRGLFHHVLQAEFLLFPKAFMRHGRSCFEDVLTHFSQRDDDPGGKAIGTTHTADLLRSENVCLQEIQIALIAGNLKINGVGTLLSNMYLDVSGTNLTEEDPAWLREYHMGAHCALTYAVIPEVLDGVAVHEIIVDMFHVGLILLATSDPRTPHLAPILDTETCLQYGDLALILTYHDQRHVGMALQIVGLRHAAGSLRHQVLLASTHNNHSVQQSYDLPNGDFIHKNSSNSILGNEMNLPFTPTRDSDRTKSLLSVLPKELQRSADDLEALANELGQRVCINNRRVVTPSGALPGEIKYSTQTLPDDIKGHIIISMEGDAPLRNLPLLLRNLWHEDPRECSRSQPKPIVVVLHPDPRDDIRHAFSRFDGLSLFFVRGSPDSRSAWLRAKLSKAKAVANLANYTRPAHVTDARTIFTLLTLDVSTKNDQDLFVCSQLIDEKSLEFLREPIHARRRGAILGESNMSLIRDPQLDALLDAEEVSNGQTGEKELQTSSKDDNSQPHDSGNEDESDQMISPVRDAQALPEKMPSQQSKKTLLGGDGSVKSAGSRFGSRSKLLLSDSGVLEKQQNGVDPSDKPGAARARRGTLFSRSRYAAGELLVQSSAITLLAREYIEPGFIDFFTNVLGTASSCPGLKIRLVSIPPSMFSSHGTRPLGCTNKVIRYNYVFNALVRQGVTPLGIYRSGTAPVLLPSKQRVKRGHALISELEELLAKRWSGQRMRTQKSQNNGTMIKAAGALFSIANDLVPSKMKEAQGKAQLHGDTKQTESTSETSDDDGEGHQRKGMWSRSFRWSNNYDASHQPATHDEADEELGEIPPRRSSIELPNRSSSFPKWSPPLLHRILSNDEDALEVPGKAKYTEHPAPGNLLPYVFTLPDPNTWCAATDGIYVLCSPDYELPLTWMELGNS